MVDHSTQLGTEPISKLLFKFSIPAVTAYLVHAFYNIADRIVVGRGVGSEGLTAIALAMPLMIFQFSFGILVGIGATAMISIHLGEKRKDRAEAVMGNAMSMLIGLSIGFIVINIWFFEPLLNIFQIAKYEQASDYLKIILGGTPMLLGSFVLGCWIRAEGNPKTTMIIMIFGALLNIILDIIAVFYLKMGVQGAAWATIISQSVSMCLGLFYFRRHSMLKFRLHYLKIVPKTAFKILSVGLPAYSMEIAASFQNAVMNSQLYVYGKDQAVAAMGIIFPVEIVLMMIIFGISDGIQPVFGYNHGARQFGRVKQGLIQAVAWASGIAALFFLLVQFFSDSIVMLFSKDAALNAVTVNGLQIFMLAAPLLGFQIITTLYFQATDRGGIATFLSLSRQALILIPMLLILPKFKGLNGVWMAAPVSDGLATILTILFIYFELKKLDRLKKEQAVFQTCPSLSQA